MCWELLRPSTLRDPSFDFTPIQSKLGVLSWNYSERARERYMVLALVLALASATACGHIRKPVSPVVVHARSPSTRAALPPTPRGGIAVAVFLPPEFFSPLCYEPFSPATRAMDTTICYNIDQTFRGALMLGGAAFTVLSGVSWMCWATFHNEDVNPEPLSDATERARMTRDTAAFEYCERLRASGDPLQIAQANGLAYAYLRPNTTARVSRSRFEQLMALRGKMLVSRRLQNLGFGEYAPAIVDDLRYEEPAAIEGLSADEVGLIADQVWVEPGRKKRFVESLTGLPKEGGQWKAAVIGTGFQLGRLKVSLEWGDKETLAFETAFQLKLKSLGLLQYELPLIKTGLGSVELLEGLDAEDLEEAGDALMTPLDKERFVKFFTDAKLATDLVDDKSGKDDATTGIGP